MKHLPFLRRKLSSLCRAAAAMPLLLAACATVSNDLVADQTKVGASVSGVGHYGSMIGIPNFSVDGFSAGNATGWGGGGGGACCVLLPAKVTKPVMVTVKWESCDVGHIRYVDGRAVDREARCKQAHHEARVPIHFTVEPAKSSGLYVHFFPGHTVEVWSTFPLPASSAYPGPKYPRGPAPDYAPLPGEKPAQPGIDDK